MGRKKFISGCALLIFNSILLTSATKDDKKQGFDMKAFEKSLKPIPAGSLMYADSSWISEGKVKGRTVNVNSFYLCDHVVTNKEYRMFLREIRISDPQLYTKMYPDTLAWFHHRHEYEAMTNMYFWHPGYDSYPVVGVSHQQAECYCKWLTDKYMKDPNRKYKNAKVCLPDIYQWDWAAYGGHKGSAYPWPGPYVRNYKGQFLANFIHTPETAVRRFNDTGKLEFYYTNWADGYFPDPDKNAMLISTAISYWPNDYGLYNMAGNVAEYVSEVGVTKGGDWNDPGYYIQIWVEEHYENAQSTSDKVGFRVAVEEVK